MMNCPKCGSNVNQGEMFCRVCGAKIVSQSVQPNQIGQTPIDNQSNQMGQIPVANQQVHAQNQYVSQQQPIMNNNVGFGASNYSSYSNDETLINAYIGKNADKLKNGGFSLNTFFFGNIYVLYRKMWMLGIIWFLASMIISMFLSYLSGVLTLVANIFISTQFKKWYVKHVEEKVAKIKSENPNASQEQLLMICTQKGGTTIISIGIMIVLLYFLLTVLGILESVKDNANNYDDTYNNSSVSGSGDIGNLSLSVPSSFEKGSYNTDDYLSYSLYDYNSNDSCSITISTIYSRIYDSVSDYLEHNVYYSASDTVSAIEQKNINNNNWAYMSVKKSYNTTYYYAGEDDDEIYVIKFSIAEDSGKCSSAYTSIINSLKFN